MPQWLPPDACFVERAHAPLVAGDEARAVIVRERSVVDRLNDDKRACRLNYSAYRAAVTGSVANSKGGIK